MRPKPCSPQLYCPDFLDSDEIKDIHTTVLRDRTRFPLSALRDDAITSHQRSKLQREEDQMLLFPKHSSEI
jgi:hypothetical protein